MYKKSTQKIINRIIFIVIIFAILCGIGIYILKYEVQGETNIPFEITKIAIAQSVNGIENEGHQEKWNFNVSENNDIYIYLEKNSRYNKTEIIKDVTINNIKINKTDSIGETKIYKPVEDEKVMFKNTNENETEEIVYTGEMESNVKQQKISNQGGIIAFRYAINNLSNYISNENEEVDYGKLLQLTDIKEENIKTTISFDFIITLTTNRKYQTNIQIDIPAKEVIEKGVATDVTISHNVTFNNKPLSYTLLVHGEELVNPYNISDTTKFGCLVRVHNDDPKIVTDIKKLITVNAYYPKYVGGAKDEDAPIGELMAMLTKQPISSSAYGTYSVTSLDDQYIWFCIPATMTINKVTLNGFTVSMEEPIIKEVGSGENIHNYNCYRTTNRLSAGTRNFVVS